MLNTPRVDAKANQLYNTTRNSMTLNKSILGSAALIGTDEIVRMKDTKQTERMKECWSPYLNGHRFVGLKGEL